MLKGLGDLGNMGNIMKKAMSMQKEIKKVQKELKKKTVEAEVGGGMVKVTANGQMEITEINIDKNKLDPSDTAMVEEMVLSGVNEALRKAKETAKEAMSEVTGGMGLPGLDQML